MTFGRSPSNGPFSTGFGPAPATRFDSPLDAPYADGRADGFGGRGPDADGFGAPTLQAGQAASAPATEIAQQATAASAGQRLAAPPAIDFGEVVTGEHPTATGHVFNLHPTYEAHLQVSLAGSPDVALVSHPDRLRPSKEGPGVPIALMYQPTKRAVSRATLTVTATWQMDAWPKTTVEIPVTARAYAPGERTHAEEDAAQAADAAAHAKAVADRTRDEELERRTIADNNRKERYPDGAKNAFDDEFEEAKAALELMTDEQANGVDEAGEEATAYRRQIQRKDPSALFAVAMFGIDMATAGIVGSLAARLGSVVSQKVKVPPRPEAYGDALIWSGTRDVALNPPEAVALVVESFKSGLKDAGKSGRKAAFATEHGGTPAGADSGARIEFFSEQRSALARAKRERAHVLIDAMRHLRPLLRSAPDEASRQMRRIREELQGVAAEAKKLQAIESRLAWMRYLSQNELGSLDTDEAKALGLQPGAHGESITDTRGALELPREHDRVHDIDGVLDIEFVADYDHPEAPVAAKGARIAGIHASMIRRLLQRTPRALGVVVRAHGTAPGHAVFPLTVVRDEAGNVRLRDETGAAGQASTWLSRKGGSMQATPERQRLGAVKLMDELIDTPLADLGKVETDHDGT